jgi:hypothetical protein
MRIVGVLVMTSATMACASGAASRRVEQPGPSAKAEPAWITAAFEAGPSAPAGLEHTPTLTLSAMPDLPILVDVPNTGLGGSVEEFPHSVLVRLTRPLGEVHFAVKASTRHIASIATYDLDGKKTSKDSEATCMTSNGVGAASAPGIYAIDVLTHDGGLLHGPFKLLIYGENRDRLHRPDSVPAGLPVVDRSVIRWFPLLLDSDLEDPLTRLFLFDRAPESLFAFVQDTGGKAVLSKNEPVLVISPVRIITLDGHDVMERLVLSPKPLGTVLALPAHYRKQEMPSKLAEPACEKNPDCREARIAVEGMQSDREAAYQKARTRLLQRLGNGR